MAIISNISLKTRLLDAFADLLCFHCNILYAVKMFYIQTASQYACLEIVSVCKCIQCILLVTCVVFVYHGYCEHTCHLYTYCTYHREDTKQYAVLCYFDTSTTLCAYFTVHLGGVINMSKASARVVHGSCFSLSNLCYS